jgi:hypothetical protein
VDCRDRHERELRKLNATNFHSFSASRSQQSGFPVQLLAGLALPISFYRFGGSYRDLNRHMESPQASRTRYNAPSQEVPVIIRNETRNEAKLMKWKLVPSWVPQMVEREELGCQ